MSTCSFMKWEKKRRTSQSVKKLMTYVSQRVNGIILDSSIVSLPYVMFSWPNPVITYMWHYLACVDVQQAFSSDRAMILHFALPALEALHRAWTKHAERAKYVNFVPALNAGLQNLEDYYSHTADSNAYTFAMCALFHNLLDHLTVLKSETF